MAVGVGAVAMVAHRNNQDAGNAERRISVAASDPEMAR